MVDSVRVTAVIVAFNRRELLLEALEAIAAQTRQPERVIVIDNCSTDGSAAAVRSAFPTVDLVSLDRNTGGAGGFTVGLERAVTAGADWVWLMDDDTIPDPTALVELLVAERAAPPRSDVFASSVRWTDGRQHPMNTPRTRPFASARAREKALRFGCYPIRSASFVSVLIRSDAVRRLGLPVADYFLWNDDFEYTARLLRRSRGYCCAGSTVEHRTRVFGSTDADPGERFLLEVRNKTWVLTRSPSLSLFERILYSGSSLRRWVRTFRSSRDRRVLRAGLASGLMAGFRAGPRSNADVLAGFGAVTDAISSFESRHTGRS